MINENLINYERAVLKEFAVLNEFGKYSIDEWLNQIVIINRNITTSGMFLNFNIECCLDQFNESELIPMDGEVRLISPDLENGAGFLLYKMKNSNCIYSLEGYSYCDSWISSSSDFSIDS